ncbi:MAG TPA: DnaB-like helicase N-terminal domain-containing protein [Pseudonocardiaceae bacterium]|nr:DnaB-like helicase N-terminal domain-containing protein [Pseudonocardiaceae bacterium]
MTGALTALTPREFAERALVGTLLWQPGRILDIAAWLDAEDFRTPANGVVFRHLRDAVAEACGRVQWGTVQVHAEGGSGRTSGVTDADEALRTVMVIADNLSDMREHPSSWSDVDIEAERHACADASARCAAEHPGLLQQLDVSARAEIDAVLALASVNPYAVPGVDAVSLFERISASTEPGDRSISAPFLHTLMATAPATSMGQPEVYGQMVLEASIRRQVQQAGMRVAQASQTTAELGGLLAAVETAVNDLDVAQQRWGIVNDGHIGTTSVDRPSAASLRSVPQRVDPDTLASRLDLVAPMPEEGEVATAEETVLAAVLVRPDTLSGLAARLHPEDFADDQLGLAFRAAIDVHTTARATGSRVDPVTVVWEQQRHAAQHGAGISVDRLMRIVERGPVGDLGYAAEVVMRGRLARLTVDAARAVQQAAQHPGLQPADVLHTTRLAYDAVRATVTRMSGEPSNPSPDAGGDSRPHEPVDQPGGSPGRSSAQVIQLRQRAANLRNAILVDSRNAHGSGRPVHPVQAVPSRDAEQHVERDIERGMEPDV